MGRTDAYSAGECSVKGASVETLAEVNNQERRKRTMLPYQDRVIAEHAELTARIEKLSAFLTSKRASSEVEHRLLLLQRLAMLMYQAILAERIAMWTKG